MKKILLSTFTLQGGGAEKFILTIASEFSKMGYDVHVISFKQHIDYNIPKGITLHFFNYRPFRILPNNKFRSLLISYFLDKKIKKEIGNPFFILSNLFPVDKILHFSKFKGVIYVLHNTLSLEFKLKTCRRNLLILKKLYSNHPVIGVSKGVISDYRKNINNNYPSEYIYNPIDKILISALARDEIVPMQDYIVHVGKFKKQKNHALLIAAYARTNKKKKLVLVGAGSEMPVIKAMVNDLGLIDKVIFMGFQQNPYPYISQSSGMVLSSDYEGFGIVIAEALALNVPVISTDCPSGPGELLPRHCLVPVGDANLLAKKMNDLMSYPDKFKNAFDESMLPENVARKYLEFASQCFPKSM